MTVRKRGERERERDRELGAGRKRSRVRLQEMMSGARRATPDRIRRHQLASEYRHVVVLHGSMPTITIHHVRSDTTILQLLQHKSLMCYRARRSMINGVVSDDGDLIVNKIV